jgi:hypothetical protein
VPEVVGRELELPALRRRRPRRGHDAAVVDQQVELGVLGGDLLGERAHALLAREVELADLELGAGRRRADLLGRPLAFRARAAAHDHVRAMTRELAARDQPQPAVGAGDDGYSAGLVRDLVEGPFLAHGASHTPSSCEYAMLSGCAPSGGSGSRC